MESETQRVHKDLLPEVHKFWFVCTLLFHNYFNIGKGIFSIEAIVNVFAFHNDGNNCFLMHVHKDITDTLDSNEIAKDFVTACNDRRKYFGSF
mgnify:CR=1 FL=1